MLEPISAPYLFAIGALLIGLEAIVISFILFFIGLGFIVVSAISYFYIFESGIFQIAIAFSSGLVLAYFFRDYFLDKFLNPPQKPEERSYISGFGYIEDGMIKFEGTYWKTFDDISNYKDGDKVEIIDVVENMVVLKK